MNRSGITRIIEVMIAILIIAGVVLILAANNRVKYEKDLSGTLQPYLEEIAKDYNLRNEIITSQDSVKVKTDVENFVRGRIVNPNYNFSVEICKTNELCALENYPEDLIGDVYAAERILSTTLQGGESKKIRIYLWRIR